MLGNETPGNADFFADSDFQGESCVVLMWSRWERFFTLVILFAALPICLRYSVSDVVNLLNLLYSLLNCFVIHCYCFPVVPVLLSCIQSYQCVAVNIKANPVIYFILLVLILCYCLSCYATLSLLLLSYNKTL